ncbi:tol-pal system protein YbgF [Nitratidesulfovibrio sp. HK-II]|uniref:tol-pal system protein YbgF n=1 Tax=Nitratidesulfovibrio sp. HK-II TaxID=2009266 RepID=UPI000E2F7E81|nr:tol-pal system protein YbgF [Nitratidesulfovibrio sp. HK-II]GBO96048.1 TPR repeat containing exported protein [Nitratidesulfovibrio sp. HK-II]
MKTRIVSRRFLPVCSLAALVALSGCVRQEDVDALNARVMRQDQQIQTLNSQLSGVQPAQADTWSQVQSTRQEIATLRGQIDDMQMRLNATGDQSRDLPQMRDQLNRHDIALRQMASQLAIDIDSVLAAPAPAGAASGAAPSTGMTHAGDPNAPVLLVNPGKENGFVVAPSSQPTGPVTVPPAQSGTMAVTSAEPAKAAPAPAAKPAAAAVDTAQALYDQGMTAFNERRYKDSVKAFTDFTTTFGDHRLTSNAWFWQGEANFQQQDFARSALAYEQVISKYPKSPKYASALLKQGICFYKLGKKDAGKVRLEELIKKLPDSPEAQRAKKFLSENK